ncbi:MAG: DegT/DnrJ/EryC1/StrS family aminotransferase [Anaerovoracaceae bacterium]
MNISFSPPDITDLEIGEVVEALKSGWITTGFRTKEFERKIAEYLDTPKCVCLNSATAAMEIMLRVLGVGPGDQVITTAYTYTATAAVIDHVGAEIVLVDTGKDSFQLDYDAIASAITEKTKAIIPVDVGGRLCDYDRIYKAIESKKDLFKANSRLQELFGRVVVIADSAHGFGAEYKGIKSGHFADFTTFSFHAVKNLTTGEGGALVWKPAEFIDDEKLYQGFMIYSLHGQTKDALQKTKLGSWEYDILYPAYKCNMTDMQAALGLKQLERYPWMLKRRAEIIGRYDEAFLPLGIDRLQHFDEDNQSSGHLYLLRVPGITPEERNQIIVALAERGIATNVHYKPLPMLSAYKNLGFNIEDYPNATAQYENEITLPLHTKLTDEEVDYICAEVAAVLRKVSKK